MGMNWEFIVQEAEDKYYCILCGCHVSSVKNVWEHYNGNRHSDSLSLYGNDITDRGDNRYYCNLCDCTVSGYRNVRKHVIGQRHDDLLNESKFKVTDKAMDTEWEFILQEGATSYYCILCGYDIFGKTKVRRHYHGYRHKVLLSLYGNDITDQGDNSYNCSLCDCGISGYRNVRKHVTGNSHCVRLRDTRQNRFVVKVVDLPNKSECEAPGEDSQYSEMKDQNEEKNKKKKSGGCVRFISWLQRVLLARKIETAA